MTIREPYLVALNSGNSLTQSMALDASLVLRVTNPVGDVETWPVLDLIEALRRRNAESPDPAELAALAEKLRQEHVRQRDQELRLAQQVVVDHVLEYGVNEADLRRQFGTGGES